jgi:hypothetical protein
MLFVPYQRGDSGVPPALSNLHCSKAVISLEVDVTARCNELFRHGIMPISGIVVERCVPILVLTIDVTARSNELLRDGRMPIVGRVVERRAPFIVLKIDVTALCNELFRDGILPICR